MPPFITPSPNSVTVLIVSKGGREHALACKLAQSPSVSRIFVLPGNVGTEEADKTQNVTHIKPNDYEALVSFAKEKGVGLVVAGPEDAVVDGIGDHFHGSKFDFPLLSLLNFWPGITAYFWFLIRIFHFLNTGEVGIETRLLASASVTYGSQCVTYGSRSAQCASSVRPVTCGTSRQLPQRDMKHGRVEPLLGQPRDEAIATKSLYALQLTSCHGLGGIPCFAPSRAAAEIEGSKAYAKDFMKKYDIPTARGHSFEYYSQARAYIKARSGRVVVKASGLAAGKGVIVARNKEEALEALDDIMVYKKFGKEAGDSVVVEHFLEGEEISLHTFCDAHTHRTLPAGQDQKQAWLSGPNTGGMGVYTPTPFLSEEDMEVIDRTIIKPTLDGLDVDGKLLLCNTLDGYFIATASDTKIREALSWSSLHGCCRCPQVRAGGSGESTNERVTLDDDKEWAEGH